MKLAIGTALVWFIACLIWATGGIGALAGEPPEEEIVNYQRAPLEVEPVEVDPIVQRGVVERAGRVPDANHDTRTRDVPQPRSLSHHRKRASIRKRAEWSVKAAIRLQFPKWARADARRVSRCEHLPRVPVSQGGAPWPDNRNSKRGKAGERSAWQIHPIHRNWVDMAKLERSAWYATAVAKRMWVKQGKRFRPAWACAYILGIR